jgi:hypothetical protein
MLKESIPKKANKLIPLGREGIFISYNKQITLYYRIYTLDIHKTIISSNMDFFENTPRNIIKNY